MALNSDDNSNMFKVGKAIMINQNSESEPYFLNMDTELSQIQHWRPSTKIVSVDVLSPPVAVTPQEQVPESIHSPPSAVYASQTKSTVQQMLEKFQTKYVHDKLAKSALNTNINRSLIISKQAEIEQIKDQFPSL